MGTKKSGLMLLLAALVVAAMLVGCGGKATEAPAAEAPAAEVPAQPAAPVSLDFVVWSYGIETIQDNIKNFQTANPNCTINLKDYSWLEYHDTMVGRFAAGDPPPLLYSSDHWLQEWASAGWLAPLDVAFPSVTSYSSELAPYALQGMTFDGHVYGLSYYADTIDFVYNSDQLAQAGYDKAPATWEELWDMATALKDKGITEFPMILAFSQQEGASIEAMISMIYGRHSGEGALFDASNQPTFNKEGSAACSLMTATSPHLPKAAATSGSSKSGSWAKPRPFSTAQRLTTV